MVEWQLSGARDRFRRSNTSRARIGCFVEEQMDDRHRLFRAAGVEPTRYFTELRRPVERSGTADVPDTSDTSGWPDLVPADPPEPERLRVVRFDRHPDANTVVLDAYAQAFTDQWAAAHTPESWRYTVTGDEAFRPDLSYLLVDTGAPGEPVIAFVLNAEYEEDWPEQGFSEGYTEYLGVVPEWRSRGLAGYLLGVSHGVFAARGHRFATLAVDFGNPTPAAGLYQRLGYVPGHVTCYYAVDVEVGP